MNTHHIGRGWATLGGGVLLALIVWFAGTLAVAEHPAWGYKTQAYVLILAAALLYFLPSAVALARGKANCGAIFLLNLLGGWTFVGWVAAVVWAMMIDRAGAPAERLP